ncbi:MAG: energy-coupling factor transporter transmembrane component T [Christensenellaceae bacterium]
MKNLNPACKMIGILVPTVALAFFYRPMLNLIVFAVCIGVLFLSKVSAKKIGLMLIPAAVAAVGLFFTGYTFQGGTPLGVELNIFTDGAVANGLQLSTRVLAFVGLGALFVLTTDKMMLVRSAEQQLRLPSKFAYGLLAAWSMLPNMAMEYKKAKAAFASRGIYTMGISPALLKPLLVKSVRWSEALAMAMESKGFGEGEKRSRYYDMKVTKSDIIFPICTCACMAIALWVWQI